MTRNENGPRSDDRGDMENHTPFAERDADAAVSGRVPANPELVSVQRALSHMKEALVMEPTTEVISAHAAQFAAAVPPPTSAPEARRASPWRRRVATSVALAVVGGLGVAGVAAADEAAPGDLLYGVDQALESVGVLDGGTPERLSEAQELLDEGDVDAALHLASGALDSDGQVEAATGLRQAALAVASQSSGEDVRARVSAMLEWMAGEDSRGADFGAAVSERARQLSGNENENANESDSATGDANEGATGNMNEGATGNMNENAQVPADPGPGNAPDTSGEAGKANTNTNENAYGQVGGNS